MSQRTRFSTSGGSSSSGSDSSTESGGTTDADETAVDQYQDTVGSPRDRTDVSAGGDTDSTDTTDSTTDNSTADSSSTGEELSVTGQGASTFESSDDSDSGGDTTTDGSGGSDDGSGSGGDGAELSVTGQGASTFESSDDSDSSGDTTTDSGEVTTSSSQPSREDTSSTSDLEQSQISSDPVRPAGVESGDGPLATQASEFEQDALNQLGGQYDEGDIRIVRDGDQLEVEWTAAGRRQQAQIAEQQVLENRSRLDAGDINASWQDGELQVNYSDEFRQERQETVDARVEGLIESPGQAGEQALEASVKQDVLANNPDLNAEDITVSWEDGQASVSPTSNYIADQQDQQEEALIGIGYDETADGTFRGPDAAGQDTLAEQQADERQVRVMEGLGFEGTEESFRTPDSAGSFTLQEQEAIDRLESDLEEQTGASLTQGEDFTINETEDGLTASLTSQGRQQTESAGDANWTQLIVDTAETAVSGMTFGAVNVNTGEFETDPVEATVDRASRQTQDAISGAVDTAFSDTNLADAFLTAASGPGALLYEQQTGQDLYNQRSEAAVEQLAETSLSTFNLPGYVSSGLEVAETGAFVAGNTGGALQGFATGNTDNQAAQNLAGLGETAYDFGTATVDWAEENPGRAVGGALALTAAGAAGTAAGRTISRYTPGDSSVTRQVASTTSQATRRTASGVAGTAADVGRLLETNAPGDLTPVRNAASRARGRLSFAVQGARYNLRQRQSGAVDNLEDAFSDARAQTADTRNQLQDLYARGAFEVEGRRYLAGEALGDLGDRVTREATDLRRGLDDAVPQSIEDSVFRTRQRARWRARSARARTEYELSRLQDYGGSVRDFFSRESDNPYRWRQGQDETTGVDVEDLPEYPTTEPDDGLNPFRRTDISIDGDADTGSPMDSDLDGSGGAGSSGSNRIQPGRSESRTGSGQVVIERLDGDETSQRRQGITRDTDGVGADTPPGQGGLDGLLGSLGSVRGGSAGPAVASTPSQLSRFGAAGPRQSDRVGAVSAPAFGSTDVSSQGLLETADVNTAMTAEGDAFTPMTGVETGQSMYGDTVTEVEAEAVATDAATRPSAFAPTGTGSNRRRPEFEFDLEAGDGPQDGVGFMEESAVSTTEYRNPLEGM